MEKIFKKIIEVVLMALLLLSFVMMGAETYDGGVCVPWTLGCMAVFAVCAKVLDKMGVFDRDGEDVEA